MTLREKGNADRISVICSAVHPILFVRHEALVEFLSEDPQFVNVKVDLNHDNIVMEQVLRMRKWKQTGLESWQIYSGNRSLGQGEIFPIVIRRLKWTKDTDILKNTDKEKRNIQLQSWPEVDIVNIYVELTSDAALLESIDKLDSKLTKGVKISESCDKKHDWNNIEIMRLYEWGMLNFIWSNEKQHQEIEASIEELTEQLLHIRETDRVPEMVMDFSIDPEEFKKIVIGS